MKRCVCWIEFADRSFPKPERKPVEQAKHAVLGAPFAG